MDKARKQTDKILHTMEQKIGGVYAKNPALLRITREYNTYMKTVQKAVEAEYRAYIDENDVEVKKEKKQAYMAKLRSLTVNSDEYNKLIKQFVKIMAEVNQEALNIVNSQMPEIYSINYNQVAVDCRKAGIKVNGKD